MRSLSHLPGTSKRGARLLITVAIGLALLAALGYGWFTWKVSNPTDAPLPQSLTGLPLTGALYGPEAVEHIKRLHGQDFPLSSGALGVYGDSVDGMTLWVSGTPAQPMAARLVDVMHERIGEGNSPFTPLAERRDGGRTVYQLVGMGQQHFYFQSGDLVIWLAADPALAERALQDALTFYP